MTNPATEQPEGQQWQQPRFSPGSEQPPAVSGQVLVTRAQVPPPSVPETVVSMVAGLVWPVMMVLGIFGPVPFVSALVIALVASSVLGAVKGRLRAQRRAAIQPPPAEWR